MQICSAKTDNLKERITKLKILETLRLGKNIFDILNQNKDICVEQLSDDHKQALEFYLHKQALEYYLSIPPNFWLIEKGCFLSRPRIVVLYQN